jgi:hypothetical protein
MSFDIYLQCWRHQLPSRFDWVEFQKVFGAYLEFDEPDSGTIRFPDGSGAQILIYDNKQSSGVSVSSAGGKYFWDAFVTFASRTGSTIFWADNGLSLVVTEPETISHIPFEVMATLGPVHVVNNGGELAEVIVKSKAPKKRRE